MQYRQSRRLHIFLILLGFVLQALGPAPACAEDLLSLPQPGHMVALSPAYEPAIIKGLKVHPDNPFLFDFILDPGQDLLAGKALTEQSQKLIKYFLAALAIPPRDVWVNLSPYEKGRIVPSSLGQTEMGRDLLAQDYVLKQIAASLTYPEHGVGKAFWQKVYARSGMNASRLPVNTLNKVWIVADRAEIFERNNTAIVVKAHLKVMLEEDVLALEKRGLRRAPQGTSGGAMAHFLKESILPTLEHEVNTGKNFANLRQVFNSIVLAAWYRKALRQAVLNRAYTGHGNVKGIAMGDTAVTAKIYERYLQAYKKGVYNFIREDAGAGTAVPRKYFAGGVVGEVDPVIVTDAAMAAASLPQRPLMAVEADVAGQKADAAMSATAPAKRLDDRFQVKLAQGGYMTVAEMRRRTWNIQLWYGPKGLGSAGFTWGDSGEPVKNDSYAKGIDENGQPVQETISRPVYVFILRDGEYTVYAGRTDYERTFGRDEKAQQLLGAKDGEVSRAEQEMDDLKRMRFLFPALLRPEVSGQLDALEAEVAQKGVGDPTFEHIRSTYEAFTQALNNGVGSTGMAEFFPAWNSFKRGMKYLDRLINDADDLHFIRAEIEWLEGEMAAGKALDVQRVRSVAPRLTGLYNIARVRRDSLLEANGEVETSRRSSLSDAMELMLMELRTRAKASAAPLPVFVAGKRGWLVNQEVSTSSNDGRITVYDGDHPLPQGQKAAAALWVHPSSRGSPDQASRELSAALQALGAPDADLEKAPRLHISLSEGLQLRHTDLERLLFRLGFTAVEQASEMRMLPVDGALARRHQARPVFRYGVYAWTHPPQEGVDLRRLPPIAFSKSRSGAEVSSRASSDGEIPWSDLNLVLGGDLPNTALKPGSELRVYAKGRQESVALETAFDAARWLLDYAAGPRLSGPLADKVAALRENVLRVMTMWDDPDEPYLTYAEGQDALNAMASAGLTLAELEILMPPPNTKQQQNWPYNALNFDDAFLRAQFYRKLGAPNAVGLYSVEQVYAVIQKLKAEREDTPARVKAQWEKVVDGLMEIGVNPSVEEFFHVNGVDSSRSQRLLTERFRRITGETLALEEFIHQRVWEQGLLRIATSIETLKSRRDPVTMERTAQELYNTWAYFRTLHAEVARGETVGASLQWWINEFNFGDADEFHFVPEPEVPAPDAVQPQPAQLPAPAAGAPNATAGATKDAAPQRGEPVPANSPPQAPAVSWHDLQIRLHEAVTALEAEQGQADIKAVAGRLNMKPDQLLAQVRSNIPGINGYTMLTQYRIFVPWEEINSWEKNRKDKERKDRDRKIKEREEVIDYKGTMTRDVRYQGFEGQLATAVWFFRQFTDEQLKRMGMPDPDKSRLMVEAAQYLRNHNSSYYTSGIVDFLSSITHREFEFNALPEDMRRKFVFSRQRADMREFDQIARGFTGTIGDAMQQGESDYAKELVTEGQRFQDMKGALGRVSIQVLALDLLKQNLESRLSSVPEVFLARPASVRREAILSFLAEVGTDYRQKFPEMSKASEGQPVTEMESIISRHPAYGVGQILFPALAYPTPLAFSPLLRMLGDDISVEGLEQWVNTRGGFGFFGLKHEYEIVLPQGISRLTNDEPGFMVDADRLGSKLLQISPRFKKIQQEKYPAMSGGDALLHWIKAQDQAIDDYTLLSRYHVYLPTDRSRNWEASRAGAGVVIPRQEALGRGQNQSILVTQAFWFFDQFSDQEMMALGMKIAEIRQYRQHMAELRYVWDTQNASYLTQEQLDILLKLDDLQFPFDRLPKRFQGILRRASGVGEDRAIREFQEIGGFPSFLVAKKKYSEVILKNMNLFLMFVHILKDRVRNGPSAMTESLFAVRPVREQVLARLSWVGTMAGVMNAGKKQRGVEAAQRWFSGELTYYGPFYGAANDLSFESAADAITKTGHRMSAENLKAWFTVPHITVGVTPASFGIDKAMTTHSPEGGIKLNADAMALDVHQEGVSAVVTPGLNAMGRLSQEALDRLAPVIRSVRPVDVRALLGLAPASVAGRVR